MDELEYQMCKELNVLGWILTMKERIGYVDATKGLGMLLIMFGHVTEYDNPVDLWMSSFKVVIFYIMSGFLMSYSGSIKKRSFGVL